MKRRIGIAIMSSFSVLVAGILFTNVLFYVASKPYIYSTPDTAPSAEVALIPGAALTAHQTPAPIFIDRVNTAIALYKAGQVSKILVSGDNGTLSHNEVNPVKRYLLSQGIPEQDIFLDHAGFNTYSSMYRARAIFGVTSALITSQAFHLPRAVFIARSLGMQAFGVRTNTKHILFRNYIREIFADEKALFDLVFHTQPKYLGPTIPITGDGRNYP
ncbi:MAG TPA: ElyC/SanA/YdcF family protein [Candidatus Paceibacterota bacterium]|nr:ElyC/SanA/YdcF family protein [Candidatus Paceibacterota bacterium]